MSAFAERLVADDPPRLYLPEDESRPDASTLTFRVSYRSEAERIAALVGPRDLGQAVDASTDHALLVLLGEYARHLGLIERLQAVPIDQRQGDSIRRKASCSNFWWRFWRDWNTWKT